jgi:hypothetical protein
MRNDGSEALIPERTAIPAPNRAWFSPWLAVGILSTIVFVALGRMHLSDTRSDIILYWGMHPNIQRAYYGFRALTATLEGAAAVAVWWALLRPKWSDRLLWCAAATMTVFVGLPSLAKVPYWDYFAVSAMVGFTSWSVVAWYSSFQMVWRILATGACSLLAVIGFAAPVLFLKQQPIYVAGSFAAACSIWCLSIALTRRFNIELFERD